MKTNSDESKKNIDSLMISVSGVRGVVGETLTPELLTRFGAAFGTYMNGGCIVVGRDTRVSGAMVKHSVFAGLMSAGCQIIDIDVCPTPTCQVMIREAQADGGIVISASHNPVEWNALKFFGGDGIYLDFEQGKELLDIYYKGEFNKVPWNEIKVVEENPDALDVHLKMILEHVDVETVRKKKFKVVLDSCNGAGSVITPRLLETLGCEVIKIHCEPSGYFPHNPEPIFINLGDLSKMVKMSGADVGFAQDADADRIAVVSETGEILGEEYSLAMVADSVLSLRKGDIVVNLSTSRMVDDLARKYGTKVIRTKVGEVNVAKKIKEVGAVIGGEGNGGIIDPAYHLGRDSLVGIVLILEYMSREGLKISELAGRLKKYYMIKEKVGIRPGQHRRILEHFEKKHKKESMSLLDGVRVDWDDTWIHVRPSGTEPIVRVIAESGDPEKVKKLCAEAIAEIAAL